MPSFISFLGELKIFFSYVKEDNNFDTINCVLMTTIPSFLYNYFSTHADFQFNNKKMKFLEQKNILNQKKNQI